MPATNPKLGFIGAGMMSSAMINGIIAAKVTKPEHIIASDVYQPSLDRLKTSGIRTSQDNMEVVSGADVVILAVKPDVIPAVLKEIDPHLIAKSLVVSIAAGVPLAVLEQVGQRMNKVNGLSDSHSHNLYDSCAYVRSLSPLSTEHPDHCTSLLSTPPAPPHLPPSLSPSPQSPHALPILPFLSSPPTPPPPPPLPAPLPLSSILHPFQLVPGKRVVRVMPNTPCLVSECAAAFSLGSVATEDDREVVQSLLGAVGYACEVKESQLDAVTGVNDSNPAYMIVQIKAFAHGGVLKK
eukprot:jgi/Undpi1/5236/HiC_scaffold_2.g00517.m1